MSCLLCRRRSFLLPAMSDEEFLAFCAANEPYQFEINEKGEILRDDSVVVLKAVIVEGYVFRELDDLGGGDGRGFAVNSNAQFQLAGLHRFGCLMRPGFLPSDWNSLTSGEQEKLRRSFALTSSSRFVRRAIVRRRLRRRWASGWRMGRGSAWLIDPIRKLAIVYRPGLAPETIGPS